MKSNSVIKNIWKLLLTIRSKLHFLLTNWRYNKQRKKFLNGEFILSDKFQEFYGKKINDYQVWKTYTNDALEGTSDFKYRHKSINRILGVWRRKGVILNKDLIGKYVFDKNLKGLDFGGAYGPISQNIDILDIYNRDIFGNKVKYTNIDNISEKYDFVFSSHTFEHLPNLEDFVSKVKGLLKDGGALLLNLPSFSCNRRWAGKHTNDIFSDHKYTFKLAETNADQIDMPAKLKTYLLDIDTLIEKYFTVHTKEYTGDNSIFIYATKE